MTLATDAQQPLKLANGKLVFPGGRVVDGNVQPPVVETRQVVVQTKRKLSDLPDLPRSMNTISVVLGYSLFGLDDADIALATGIGVDQIERIRTLEGYTTMHDAVVNSILDAETENIRDIFKQHSRAAADVLVDGLHNGSRSDRMSVAKDFLDRAGHRPADIVEHRHRMDGGLTIEIVRKDSTLAPPVIDVALE